MVSAAMMPPVWSRTGTATATIPTRVPRRRPPSRVPATTPSWSMSRAVGDGVVGYAAGRAGRRSRSCAVVSALGAAPCPTMWRAGVACPIQVCIATPAVPSASTTLMACVPSSTARLVVSPVAAATRLHTSRAVRGEVEFGGGGSGQAHHRETDPVVAPARHLFDESACFQRCDEPRHRRLVDAQLPRQVADAGPTRPGR